MKNLTNLLEDVQYGREGRMNEDDLYEVTINKDQFSEEEKNLLLENVEWFEVEEENIYITISQKAIDSIFEAWKCWKSKQYQMNF